MRHHGEIAENAIIKSGMTRKAICKAMRFSRQTLANKLDTDNLPIDFFIQLGKIINHDFSTEVNSLSKLTNNVDIKENEDQDWKDKYITLLEVHNKFLSDKIEKAININTTLSNMHKDFKFLVNTYAGATPYTQLSEEDQKKEQDIIDNRRGKTWNPTNTSANKNAKTP